MKQIEFVIEAERTNSVDNVISMYLRDNNDGAIWWTRDPDKAKRFASAAAAEAFARRHTNMACMVVRA